MLKAVISMYLTSNKKVLQLIIRTSFFLTPFQIAVLSAIYDTHPPMSILIKHYVLMGKLKSCKNRELRYVIEQIKACQASRSSTTMYQIKSKNKIGNFLSNKKTYECSKPNFNKKSKQHNVFSINHLVSPEHLQKSGEISCFLCRQKVI